VLTLALGSDGVIYQEDVKTIPGALTAVYSAIEPDSLRAIATADDREFMLSRIFRMATEIPYTYTPPNFDRLSQVAPARRRRIDDIGFGKQLFPSRNFLP